MTIYLAGPMTGLPNFNHDEFCRHAERLRSEGHIVLNPAESDGGNKDKPREWYIRAALQLLLQAETVAVLQGWMKSKGAALEVLAATELCLDVVDVDTLEPIEATIRLNFH